jgi:hypothetical protein
MVVFVSFKSERRGFGFTFFDNVMSDLLVPQPVRVCGISLAFIACFLFISNDDSNLQVEEIL